MSTATTIVCASHGAGHGEPGPFSRCTQIEVRRPSGRVIIEAFGTPRGSSAIVRLFRLEMSQTDAEYMVDVLDLGGHFRFHNAAPARGWSGDNGDVARVHTGAEPSGQFKAELLSMPADGPLLIAPAGVVEAAPIEFWISDADRVSLVRAIHGAL